MVKWQYTRFTQGETGCTTTNFEVLHYHFYSNNREMNRKCSSTCTVSCALYCAKNISVVSRSLATKKWIDSREHELDLGGVAIRNRPVLPAASSPFASPVEVASGPGRRITTSPATSFRPLTVGGGVLSNPWTLSRLEHRAKSKTSCF
jgi:hypothetical protein